MRKLGKVVAQQGERKPAFVVALLALGPLLFGAGSGDSGAPVVITGTTNSPIVGIEQAGTVVCSGVLVDARVVVTAASCITSPSICIEIAGACVAPTATSVDAAKRVAALTLPADADPIPIPYGRESPPGVGDVLESDRYGDGTVPIVTITSTDGQIYNATTFADGADAGVTIAAPTFVATDVGSAGTFTPAMVTDGSPVESVYGILVTLPMAASNVAVYARLDVLARDFLDPIVQGTRDVELPGGCSLATGPLRARATHAQR